MVKIKQENVEEDQPTSRGRKTKQVKSGLRRVQRCKTPTSHTMMDEAQEKVASDGSWEEDIPMTVPVVNINSD